MADTKPSLTDKIDRMRDAYVGFENGDLDTFLQVVRDDAVWHSQLTGSDLKGKAAIRGALERLLSLATEYKVDVHDILANEAHMVVLERHNGRFKNGTALNDSLSTAVYHLDDEGYVTEVWPIMDTALFKQGMSR